MAHSPDVEAPEAHPTLERAPAAVPTFRVFVSSPGDVAEERALAERVIMRLGEEFDGRLRVEGIFWEEEPLLASDTFQAQLTRPADADVVVCILWSRLGTPLPERFKRPDGSRYASGTEFEFEDAVEAFRQTGRPELLVYRKTTEPVVALSDPDVMNRLQQKRALDAFLSRWFHDQSDGTLRAAFHPFATPDRFEELLETHLRKLVVRRLPERELTSHTRATSWHKGSPFRGLEPFDAEHTTVFFGRTRATAEALRLLREHAAEGTAFLLVVGMSGSGKSSLVRAGVIPLLTQPGVVAGALAWRTIVVRPSGAQGGPLAALASALIEAVASNHESTTVDVLVAALRESPAAVLELVAPSLHDGDALAVAIDQLEELFTTDDHAPQDRAAFIATLATLAKSGRAWVVATLRSDYYSRCEESPTLMDLKAGAGQYHLLPPSTAEIAQIVLMPARLAGLHLETDAATGASLESMLVDAAAADPESLPLLEFTLEELYKLRAHDHLLTIAAYRALGGIEGAIASRAEEVWGSLGAPTSALTAVFRALVQIDPDRADTPTRRTAMLAGFAHDARAVVESFVEARLFTADRNAAGDAVVSVSHEALLRHWPRMRDSVQEDRDFLRARARLERAAGLWREDGMAPERLLPAGKPLTDALDLLNRNAAEVPPPLREYVVKSHAAAQRTRSRRRGLLAVVFVSVSAFAIFAATQWKRASDANHEAQTQRSAALKGFEAALGEGMELGFPDVSLRPEQLQQLVDEMAQLHATGYSDSVDVLVHLGRFLTVRSPTGSVRLRQPADDCRKVICSGYPDSAEERRATSAVRAMVDSAMRKVQGPPVNVKAMSSEFPVPAAYPPPASGPVAWNDSARRDHRLLIMLSQRQQ